MIRIIATLLVLLSSTALAQPASPASDVFDRGLKEFANANYKLASKLFEKAAALEDRKEFLYAWAQAARLDGDCKTATLLYKRVLQRSPSAEQVEKIGIVLSECEKNLTLAELDEINRIAASEQHRTPEQPPVAKATEDPGHVAPPVENPRQPVPVAATTAPARDGDFWSSKTPAYVTMAAGGALLLTGVGFGLAANSADGRGADIYEDRQKNLDDAKKWRSLAIPSYIVGGAVVLGGAVWWYLLPGKEQGTTVSAVIGDQQQSLVLTGSF